MIHYFNVFKLKHLFVTICKIAFFLLLLFSGERTYAQNSRIAIINLVDSNLIYKHIGFKMFKDNADRFDCKFNCNEYIDKELTRLLSTRYTVSLISIPGSLIYPNGSIYNSFDIKKEINSWISGIKDQYDYVIFVESGEQDDLMDSKKQKLQSSGLYSRGNPLNSWVAVYTTARFSLIRTSNLENLDYDWGGMDYILQFNEYQFSRDAVLIDPEMLQLIRTQLIKLFDYKLEYFLTNSYLISGDEYTRLKILKVD